MAPTNNAITGNVANENQTNGISVDAAGDATPKPTNNTMTGNQGRNNGQFDGFDGNSPACGGNTWNGNDFGALNQPCVSPRLRSRPRHRPLRLRWAEEA